MRGISKPSLVSDKKCYRNKFYIDRIKEYIKIHRYKLKAKYNIKKRSIDKKLKILAKIFFYLFFYRFLLLYTLYSRSRLTNFPSNIFVKRVCKLELSQWLTYLMSVFCVHCCCRSCNIKTMFIDTCVVEIYQHIILLSSIRNSSTIKLLAYYLSYTRWGAQTQKKINSWSDSQGANLEIKTLN